jgi:AraC-like DNA-binding protein
VPEVTSFSTTDVRGPYKAAAWRKHVMPLTRDSLSSLYYSRDFDGEIEHATLNGIAFIKGKVTPHRVVRESRSLDDGQDNMIRLVLLEHGSTQSGSIRMCAGDGSIFCEGQPYSVDVPEYSEYTSVRLPRHVVDMASLEVDRLPLRSFDATRGAGRILSNMVASIFHELPRLNESSWDIILGLSQLLKACTLSIATEDRTLSSRSVIRDRAKAYINLHLRYPELSPTQIAQALRCSTRYLHKAFETEDISVSEYILRQRLNSSRQLLSTREGARLTITDVAMAYGFSNSSQFSRTFRKEFGISPREGRQRWLSVES